MVDDVEKEICVEGVFEYDMSESGHISTCFLAVRASGPAGMK